MTRRRVVVTGLGIVSPVGNTVQESWDNIVAGRNGIGAITRFDASNFKSRIAGEVKGFDVASYLAPKEARRMDVFIHYGMAAGIQAIKDSGLEVTPENADRIGVNIGSGIGGLPMIEDTHNDFLGGGPRKISPFFIPGTIINMISGNLSILYGMKGPNLAVVTACTTGLHAIGTSFRMIQYGDADAMVCGGAESTVTPLAIGGFASAQALSTRNDDPATASRPWDKGRDGFVLGEGAGVLVLEEIEHAKKRGARIYAELAGFGMSGDAYHMTAPDTDAKPLGDKNETDAIKLAFGDTARNLIVNSTKSMTGHLLGGAGGLESALTVLAVHHQISPPTINIIEQDPECDLDYCANTARQFKIDVALKNNFGFGGTNGTLAFRRI
ncbi:MAG: beta-ketoacyl-ACP synthase II [Rhodocyclaceae bacterium UTPRO2]|nr:MAG: beta-ketoacyl-ACP synthase II [Rhodocyclaceae bacterium UTPRO2]